MPTGRGDQILPSNADVADLADALVSDTSVRKDGQVQLLSSAPGVEKDDRCTYAEESRDSTGQHAG